MGYVYDYKMVASSRKQKICEVCDKSIKIGQSSITVSVHTDDGFHGVDVCSMKCKDEFEAHYGEDDDDYDDEDEENEEE